MSTTSHEACKQNSKITTCCVTTTHGLVRSNFYGTLEENHNNLVKILTNCISPLKSVMGPLCIICFNELTCLKELLPHSFELYSSFLRFCAQYLNIEIVPECGSTRGEDGQEDASHHAFCQDCQILVNNLVHIHRQLWTLEMQLLSKVKQLGDGIKSEEDTSEGSLLLARLAPQLSLGDTSVLKTFRDKLQRKCSTKTLRILPTVVLAHLTKEEMSGTNAPPVFIDVHSVKTEQKDDSDSGDDLEDHFDDPEPLESHESSITKDKRVHRSKKTSGETSWDKVAHQVMSTPRIKQKRKWIIKQSESSDQNVGQNVLEPQCNFCSKIFPTLKDLHKHKHRVGHHSEPTGLVPGLEALTCNICDAGFTKPVALYDHTATSHGKRDLLRCQVCRVKLKGCMELRNHLQNTHEKAEDKSIFCIYCATCFTTQQLCDIHTKLRHLDRPRGIACDDNDCHQEFESCVQLNEHMRIAHETAESIFVCAQCGRGFLREYHLQLHQFNHALKSNGNFFKCNLCYRQYRSRFKLMNHYNILHSEERRIDLLLCGKCRNFYSFSKKEYDVHVKSHVGVNFRCRFCEKIFLGMVQLQKHQAEVHPDVANKKQSERRKCKAEQEGPFICEECAEQFTYRSALEIHQISHTTEPRHQCPHCDQKYKRKEGLKLHIRQKHTKVGLVFCEQGGKGFASIGVLNRHVVEAHERRRHYCHMCPKRFNSAYVLNMHVRTHTGDKLKCDWCPVKLAYKSGKRNHVKRAHPEHFEEYCASLGPSKKGRWRRVPEKVEVGLFEEFGVAT